MQNLAWCYYIFGTNCISEFLSFSTKIVYTNQSAFTRHLGEPEVVEQGQTEEQSLGILLALCLMLQLINESKGNAKLTGINYAWIRLLDVLQPFILHMLDISYVHLKIQKKVQKKICILQYFCLFFQLTGGKQRLRAQFPIICNTQL